MATQGTKITDLNILTSVTGNTVVPTVDPTVSLAYPQGRTLKTTVQDVGNYILQSSPLAVVTTTVLSSATSSINTSGKKVQGLMVFNSTNNLIYVAGGTTATSSWYPSNGGSAITPA